MKTVLLCCIPVYTVKAAYSHTPFLHHLLVCLSAHWTVKKCLNGSRCHLAGTLDGSRDEAGSGGLGIRPREQVIFGANMGHANVSNGDFAA